MSYVRVNLDIEKLRSIARSGVLPNGVETLTLPNGVKISVPEGSGDPYTFIDDHLLQCEMPSRLDPSLIKGFSNYDNTATQTPKRRVGEYRLRTATLILSEIAETHYHIQVKGERLADVQELYRLVMEGKIWPVGDYGAGMVPPPARHLRQLLRELWQIICRDVNQGLHRVTQ